MKNQPLSGKRDYTSPRIEMIKVMMEHSIAAGSATATFKGPGNDSPFVDSWNSTPNDGTSDDVFKTHKENW